MARQSPAPVVRRREPERPVWPASKPIPNFASLDAEDDFWTSHEFEEGAASDWKRIEGPERVWRRGRSER